MKAIPDTELEMIKAALKRIEEQLKQTAREPCTIKKASEITGYSESAIRNKINIGMWPEDVVWKWGPDAVQLILMEGYSKWARQHGKASMRGRHSSASTLCLTGTNTR